MIQNKIDNNRIKVKDLAIPAEDFIPDLAVLRKVRPSYAQNEQGERTDVVEAVRYDLVNPETYSSFTVKVEGSKAIITSEVLDAQTEPVYVQIPVSEVVIKPYEIAYGVAKVSIVAPYVKLASN